MTVAFTLLGVMAGALLAQPLSAPWLGVLFGLTLSWLILGGHRRWVGMLLLGTVACHFSGLAWQATAVPYLGPVTGVAQLMSDPTERIGGGWRVEVRIDEKRYDATFTSTQNSIAALLAGQRLELSGQVRTAPRQWQRTRHVVGTLRVDELGPVQQAWWPYRLANGVRRILARGTAVLQPGQAALLSGLTIGDDRFQGPAISDDFRAAGLGHLLAVSGQNVAFVLTAASPLLNRLRTRSRLPLTLLLLIFFALLTRFEPSVLRATVMAGGSAMALGAGRPIMGLRLLGVTTVALLLVDPLLLYRAAFQLSVAASGGILLLAGPLARAFPGPRTVANSLAVTLAAQAAVTPLLLVWFGPVPVAALPANLLAAPVAGLLMIWGITAGLVAGVVGPPLATVLHIPSSLGLYWISGVAAQVGERPFAALPTGGALLLVGMVFLAAGASHRENFTAARSALTAVLLALLLVGGATFLRAPVTEVSDGLRVTSAGKLVVIDDHYGAEELLGRLRRHQIVAPELLIFRNAVDQAVLAALAQRFDDVAIWAPRGPPPAVVPDSGTVVMAGQQQWQVDQQSGHLLVRPVG